MALIERDLKDINLINGDCLIEMPNIPDKSVDMILTDLPYGVLNKSNRHATWDSVIPFKPLWEQYKRIIKDNGAIVLFAQGMFTATLMLSNPTMWRYNLIWSKKNRPTGFLDANRKPLRIHEDICVFYQKQPTYNPQFTKGAVVHSRGAAGNGDGGGKNRCYGSFKKTQAVKTDKKYPVSIIEVAKEYKTGERYHPTQKPVALMEWLIKTYTNKGEVVFDSCMGSGSTGVAAVNSNRKFIGIELDENYFNISKQRIDDAVRDKSGYLFDLSEL